MNESPIIRKNIVLAGNPNSGKSTLFNALTGARQKIANYPGVTVEKHHGYFVTKSGQHITLTDLPGTYSLNTQSEDEAIAARVIQGDESLKRPDIVVVVAEAAKLDRGLLLLLQIQKIHSHVILAINMMDEFERQNRCLNVEKLSHSLKIPVVPIVAKTGRGLDVLILEIEKTDILKSMALVASPENQPGCVAIGDEYKKIDALMKDVVFKPVQKQKIPSDKIDGILLHPVLAPVIFFAVMLLLFQALFSWVAPVMDLIDGVFSILGQAAKSSISIAWLASLVSDGVIAGVGSVLVFVPQIAIAFLFIGFLEMCGYLARGAFIVDRLMRVMGLEGRAFIPLISSFSCAVPGIMSTRTMPNRRQRLITILIAPLMTCSARLPVYILLIGCFVPNTKVWGFLNLQGLTMFGLFFAGILGAVFMAMLFNKTLPKKSGSSFFMELPPYRVPSFKTLYRYVSFRTMAFIKSAGTVILFLSLILWVLASFPKPKTVVEKYEWQRQAVTQLNLNEDEQVKKVSAIDQEEAGELLRHSFMGKMGLWLEPTLKPMGFDWRLGIGVIASFAAREVFVSTMGIVFNLGEADETSQSLREKLRLAKNPDGTSSYTLRTALSLMIFFVFAAQCMSTLAVIRRETNSMKWAAFSFSYMTVLAYAMATLTYQGLGWLGVA